MGRGDGYVTYEEFRDSLIDMSNQITPRDWVLLQLRAKDVAQKAEMLDLKFTALQAQIQAVSKQYKDAFRMVDIWVESKEVPEMVAKAKEYCRSHISSQVAIPKGWDKLNPVKPKVEPKPEGKDAVRYIGKYLGLPSELPGEGLTLPNIVDEDGSPIAVRWPPPKPKKKPGPMLPEAPPLNTLMEKNLEKYKQDFQERDPLGRHIPVKPNAAFAKVQNDISSSIFARDRAWTSDSSGL